MIELSRKLRVISIEQDIPHHEVTIKAKIERLDMPLMQGGDMYLLTRFEISENNLEHDKQFRKYLETREELLRYKRLLTDFKLLMEEVKE